MLLAAIVSVVYTLKVLPDEGGWIAALIKPYDFSYFRYFVMMPLGWVLYQRELTNRQLGLLGLAALAAVLLLAWLSRRYSISIGAPSARFYEDLAISSVLTACFVFCACKRIEALPPRIAGFVKTFSVCSFGVYLLHPLFLDAVRSQHWDLTRFSAVWLYPLCYLCFLLLPMALTWVMLRIPGLKKLVS